MEKTKKVLKVIYDILKKILMVILKILKAIWSVKILRPVIIIVILIAIYLYMQDEATLKKFDDFTWPTNELVNTIEKYNTKRGRVGYNYGKDSFTMDLLIGSKNDFIRYIEKNKKKGYDLEEEFDGEVYKAKNRNNNSLSLEIKYINKANNYSAKSSMMTVTIKKEESKEEKREKEKQELEAKRKADTEAKEAEERAKRQKAEEEQKAKERKEQEQKKNESPKTTSNTIDPQFKKAMDSYESAMKEYSSFMKKYTSSSNPVSMMTDYNRIMEKYTNANNEFNKIKKESLNSAELAYYLEVQSRVVKNIN